MIIMMMIIIIELITTIKTIITAIMIIMLDIILYNNNNNTIIIQTIARLFYIHPLGNIYEIYANLTVMTNLNLNHFLIITQDELCLKGTFVKASFMFVTIF